MRCEREAAGSHPCVVSKSAAHAPRWLRGGQGDSYADDQEGSCDSHPSRWGLEQALHRPLPRTVNQDCTRKGGGTLRPDKVNTPFQKTDLGSASIFVPPA